MRVLYSKEEYKPFRIAIGAINPAELRCRLCGGRIMPIDGNNYIVRCMDCTWYGEWWRCEYHPYNPYLWLQLLAAALLTAIAVGVVYYLS